MTPAFFAVRTTSAFDREFRKLAKAHPDVVELFERAVDIMASDPHNRSRKHDIKNLEGVPPGEGQYRLRLRRFRFRYDIAARVVILVACGLRREDTY